METVEILQTKRGSPDGKTTRQYVAGEVVDMPASLAAVFIREGWARHPQAQERDMRTEHTEDDEDEARRNKKAVAASPHNKMLTAADLVNKGGRGRKSNFAPINQ